MRRALVAIVLTVCAAATAGCGSRATSFREPSAQATPVIKERPRSTARLAVLEPAPGATIRGDSVRVRVELTGGRVILETKTRLAPDEGHIHLLLNGRLVSMTYGTEQQIPVTRGSHILQVEYVAADHFPFNPRVIVVTTFTVE